MRPMLVVCTSDPLVAVTVTVETPAGVDDIVESVRIEVPDPFVMEGGENDAVVPLGIPEADRFTVPVNPDDGVTVTV